VRLTIYLFSSYLLQRGIVGNIVSRFETKGYKLAAMKTKQATKELLETHYKDLVEKPFFPKLRDYMLSGPVVCMVWEVRLYSIREK
jgi:nucleoside-diphosphate kinase